MTKAQEWAQKVETVSKAIANLTEQAEALKSASPKYYISGTENQIRRDSAAHIDDMGKLRFDKSYWDAEHIPGLLAWLNEWYGGSHGPGQADQSAG